MLIDHGWTDTRKGRYNGKCAREVWGTADRKEYSE